MNPTNPITYNMRGWVEFQKGDFDSAITDAAQAIQLDPQYGYAYGTRGWARYGKGDTSGAVEDCQTAMKFYPNNSMERLYDQGLLDFIAGNYEKAITNWQAAIQQDGGIKSELQPWIAKARAKLQEK